MVLPYVWQLFWYTRSRLYIKGKVTGDLNDENIN